MNIMIEQLKNHVEKNDLHNKVIEHFWIAFNNWRKDHPEEYARKTFDINVDELNIFVHSIGLRSSQWPDCDFSHVTITLLIYYGERQLGNYVFWFSLSNDVDNDDFFEIY